MSSELIDHNPDLKRLKDEGYAVAIRENYLLIYDIPYVNSKSVICYGTLISDLSSMSGDRTISPIAQHIAYFIGEHPCNSDGSVLRGIQNNSTETGLTSKIIVNHMFSNKPAAGYKDYYEKMTNYINLISAEALVIDNSITAKPFKLVKSDNDESVFMYHDTNSSKAKINIVTSKLQGLKIAIIGVGGTGSYVLDFIAKSPVDEIHIFDDDLYIQHNAFRSPGAPTIDDLRKINKKVEYFQMVYSRMHKNIIPHDYNITLSRLNELSLMNFVFICVDNGQIKKQIIEYLLLKNINFIDVGIGINNVNNSLLGHLRTTTGTQQRQSHLNDKIDFAKGNEANLYATNIQIAELNAMNAAFAVIKWKKIYGYYHDSTNEFNSIYSISEALLINEETDS